MVFLKTLSQHSSGLSETENSVGINDVTENSNSSITMEPIASVPKLSSNEKDMAYISHKRNNAFRIFEANNSKCAYSEECCGLRNIGPDIIFSN
jgi:hypothetical protein